MDNLLPELIAGCQTPVAGIIDALAFSYDEHIVHRAAVAKGL